MTSQDKAQYTKDIKVTREILEDIKRMITGGSTHYLGNPINQELRTYKTDLNKLRTERALGEFGEAQLTDNGEDVQVNIAINGTGIYIDRIEGMDIYLVRGSETWVVDSLDSELQSFVERNHMNIKERMVRTGQDDHDLVVETVEMVEWMEDADLDEIAHQWLTEVFADVDMIQAQTVLLKYHAERVQD